MKHRTTTYKVDGSKKEHDIKSTAIAEAERLVAAEKGNIGVYVSECVSLDYDEADRDKKKMTNSEYWINDRILVTK
jgi:hypothetical protein